MKTTALRLSKHPVFEVRKCSVPVIPSDHCSSPRTHSSVYFSGILSGHRASSEHTQITVPLPNTLISPCLSKHIQITVPLMSILRSSLHVQFPILLSNHCSPPNILIPLLIFPNTITKLKFPQHSPRTLSLSRSEHTHIYAEDSLSGRCPILQSSQPVVPFRALIITLRRRMFILADAGITDIAILHTIYSPLKTSKTLNISRINFTTCLIVQFMVPGSQPDFHSTITHWHIRYTLFKILSAVYTHSPSVHRLSPPSIP